MFDYPWKVKIKEGREYLELKGPFDASGSYLVLGEEHKVNLSLLTWFDYVLLM